MAITTNPARPPTDGPPLPVESYRGAMYARRRYDLPTVRQARDLLDSGHFGEAARLRSYIRTDPRACNAEEKLTQTLLGFRRRVEGGPSRHGNSPMEAMRREAEFVFGPKGRAASHDILQEIVEDLRGFSYKPVWIHFEPSPDGARWDPVLTPWPIDAVELDSGGEPSARRYVALLAGGHRVPIEGDNWIEFKAVYRDPHQRGAVRAIAEAWVTRQYAVQDAAVRSGSSMEPKRIGVLAPGDGETSPTGKLMAQNLAGLTRARSGMVVRNGADVKQLDVDAKGHQIFFDLEKLSSSDFEIAYNGQDGTSSLGDQGTYGARQVLYGVAYDVIRGVRRGLVGGLDEAARRWAAYNFGREEHPVNVIEVPDLEAEQARALEVARRPMLVNELKTLSARGPLELDLVLQVAQQFGVTVSPEWAEIWTRPAPPPPVPLAGGAVVG